MAKKDKGFEVAFDVNTEIQGDDIHTQVDMVMNGVIADTQKQVIKTKDGQVRKALIELGWTPPVSIVLPFKR